MIVNNKIGYNIKSQFPLPIPEKKEKSKDSINSKLTKIRSKLSRGKKLTQEELSFLQENDFALYQVAIRVMRDKEALEAQLKNCKTKEEAQAVIGNALGGLNSKDPDYEYKIAARQDSISEYQKSDTYKELPSKLEETNEKKKKEKNALPSGLYGRNGKFHY